MRRSSRIAVGTAALLLTLPAAAGAATRHASPTGSGAAPCAAAAPCPLATALGAANPGDDVQLAPGDYVSAADLSVAQDVHVHGTAGAARPRLLTSATFGLSVGDFGRLSDIDVQSSSTIGGAAIAAGGGSVVERVRVAKAGTGSAVRVMDGGTVTLRDASFLAVDGQAVQASGPAALDEVSARLDHVTAVASGTGYGLYVQSGPTRTAQADVTGSIVRGTTFDVRVDQNTTGARVSLARSFVRTAAVTTTGSPTVVDAGTNDPATPLFVDLAGGDLRQAAGSPTIDPGNAADTSGPRDPDGDPRTLGAATDAGADEFRPAPTAVTAAPAVGTTTATVRGTASGRGLAGTWAIEYGPTTAYGTTTPVRPLAASRDTVDVAAALEGLPASATLHYRLVVTTPGGTTSSPDATLTTTAVPSILVPGPTTTVPGPAVPGPTRTVAAAAPKVTGVKVRGTTLSYTASAAGQLRIVVRRGTRTVRTIVRTVRKGKGTIRLGALPKGRYRVTVSATTTPGRAVAATFRR